MKVFFDTPVLLAAIVQPHSMHTRALPWLKRAKSKEFEFFVAGHSLPDLYADLTRLPVKPKIQPGTAWKLLHENIEKSATIVTLSRSDYRETIRLLADLGLGGNLIDAALTARAAVKSGADRLLTFNSTDLRRVWPEGNNIIHDL